MSEPLSYDRGDGWPRRRSITHFHPVEKELYELITKVDNLGASPRLTEAVALLDKVRDAVADHLESHGDQAKTVDTAVTTKMVDATPGMMTMALSVDTRRLRQQLDDIAKSEGDGAGVNLGVDFRYVATTEGPGSVVILEAYIPGR